MAKIKYELNEKLKTGLYGFSGIIGGVRYIQKPWTEFTQEQLKQYAKSASAESIKKHLVIVPVKEKVENGKAKKQEPKKEATNTNGQDAKESTK